MPERNLIIYKAFILNLTLMYKCIVLFIVIFKEFVIQSSMYYIKFSYFD